MRVIYIEEDRVVWFGGDFGLIWMDFEKVWIFILVVFCIYFCEVCLNCDFVYWGGDLLEEFGGVDW